MSDPTYSVGVEFVTGSFTDITADVRQASITRTLADGFNPLNAGHAQLQLDNMDGRYSPDNTSSIYAGLMRPNLKVQVQATHSGSTYGLFYGEIDEWAIYPGLGDGRTATLTCRDTFKNAQNKLITTSLYTDYMVSSFAVITMSKANVNSFSIGALSDQRSFLWFDQTALPDAVTELLASGFYFARVNGSGTLEMMPRGYVGSLGVTSYNQFLSMSYTWNDDFLVNRARVQYQQRDLLTTSLGGDIYLPFSICALISPVNLGTVPNSCGLSITQTFRDGYGRDTIVPHIIPPYYGWNPGSGRVACFQNSGGITSNTSAFGTFVTKATFFSADSAQGSSQWFFDIRSTTSDTGCHIGILSHQLIVRLRTITDLEFFVAHTTNGTFAPPNVRASRSIGVSWNASTGSMQVMVDGTLQTLSVDTFISGKTACVNKPFVTIGRTRTDSASVDMDQDFVFFDVGTMCDFTQDWTRFFPLTDNAVGWLGDSGEVPFGTKPAVFLWNVVGSFGSNRGSGGDFAKTGSPGPPGGIGANYPWVTRVGSAGAVSATAYAGCLTNIAQPDLYAARITTSMGATNVGVSGQDIYLTGMYVRGIPATATDASDVVAEDSGSQTTYGVFERLLTSRLITTRSGANFLAQHVASTYRLPKATLTAGFRNQFPDVIGFEVGEVLHLSDTNLGIASLFRIRSLTHEIRLDAGLTHSTTLDCELKP